MYCIIASVYFEHIKIPYLKYIYIVLNRLVTYSREEHEYESQLALLLLQRVLLYLFLLLNKKLGFLFAFSRASSTSRVLL